MSTHTRLSTEIPSETLDQSHVILDRLGLDVKSYINMSLKALINTGGLPFSTKGSQKSQVAVAYSSRVVTAEEQGVLALFERTLQQQGKTANTAYAYKNAVAKIAQQEGMSLEELSVNISVLARAYARNGEKEHLGENGKGTWRNALGRFEEFLALEKPRSKRSQLLGAMADDIWIADDFDAPLEGFEEYMV